MRFIFCGPQYRIVRRLGGTRLHANKNKTQTHQLRDEVQLNCVSLRPRLDYEMARAVKGQDERPNAGALGSPPRHPGGYRDVGEKNKEGHHVGLDFYDPLIETLKIPSVRR